VEEYKLLKEEYPEKGKDIITINEDGSNSYIYRCGCHNPNCKEWRCSTMGSAIIMFGSNIVSWKYID